MNGVLKKKHNMPYQRSTPDVDIVIQVVGRNACEALESKSFAHDLETPHVGWWETINLLDISTFYHHDQQAHREALRHVAAVTFQMKKT